MSVLIWLFWIGLIIAAASFVFTVGLYILSFTIIAVVAAISWVVSKLKEL